MKDAAESIRSYAEDLLRDRKMILKILSIALILLVALVFRLHDSAGADIEADASDMKTVRDELCVDIGGAVNVPGVYKVKTDTRVFEVIELAGGLRDDADTDSINQAAYVEDGQKIVIPVRQKAAENPDDADLQAGDISAGDIGDITVSDSRSGLVNINTASREELKTLTGIGDVMADRIIEYRTAKPFRSKEDIMSVKGIGAATFDKIKDSITL
jgi:competence protein ComEA